MTQTNVRVQMQIRRDTAANWSASNPTPLAGELCYISDTGQIKVGDGSTAWQQLDYAFLPISGGNLSDHLTIHNQRELRLSDHTEGSANDHYSAFKAGSQSADLTYTLPTALPTSSGQVLSCTDAGVMSWATDSPGMATTGGTFTGDVIFDGATAGRDITYDRSADNLIFSDNAKAVFGNLSIYNDATNSFITNSTNDLTINSTGDDLILKAADDAVIQVQGSENAVLCNGDAGVQLFYDGGTNPKLETKAAGVEITGQLLNFTSGTAVLLGDGSQLELGSSNDLKIWHNANDASYIRNEYGNFIIQANAAGDDAIACVPDAEVKLYFDNNPKIETIASGCKITGQVDIYGSQAHLYNSANTDDTYFVAQNTSTGNAGIKMKNSEGEWIIIANDNLRFYDVDSTAERLTITSGGNLELAGNLKVPNNGGIDFQNQTWTSTGNTNHELFDHYEEGTFIPTLKGSTGDPSQSYAHQRASFTRIGNIVHITVDVEMAASGVSAGSGDLLLGSLPWPKNSAASNLGSGAGPAYGVSCSVGLLADLGSDYPNAAYADDNNTYFIMTRTTASSWQKCSAASVGNGSRIIMGATYRTT